MLSRGSNFVLSVSVSVGDDRAYNIETILGNDAVVRRVGTDFYLGRRGSSAKDRPHLLYYRSREFPDLGTAPCI